MTITEKDVQTLVQAGVIPNGTPPAQIEVFARVCATKNLSPFLKQIYLTGYKEYSTGNMKYSIVTGIDGYRIISARCGNHAGTDDAKYDIQSDGSFKTSAQLITEKRDGPITATITVWKIVMGVRVPFTHTAVFKEFSTGKQKWATMQYQMIAKIAEAFCLRKGWPEEMEGVSIEEEIGAIQDITIQSALIVPAVEIDPIELGKRISAITTIDVLSEMYRQHKGHSDFAALFTERKNEILDDLQRAGQ